MPSDESPMLLRIPEAARALGIARSMAYEMARTGQLPVIHIGKAVRVPRRKLEEWIEERARSEGMTPRR